MTLKTDKAEVAKLTLEELKLSMDGLQKDLFLQRLAVVTSEDSNTSKIKFIRKQIARRMQQISSLNSAELKANA